MFKKMNKKGFTLAELLIVVAIIGVLIAVSIPVFSSQLEKARQATDLANLRTAYATASAQALLDNDESSNATIYAAGPIEMKHKQGWLDAQKIGNVEVTDTNAPKVETTKVEVYVTVSTDGKVNFVTTKPTGDNVKVINPVNGASE